MIDRKSLIYVAALAPALAAGTACGSAGSAHSAKAPGTGSRPAARACTRTVGSGANLGRALAETRPGAVLCLRGGAYPGGRIPAGATNKSSYVIVKPAPGAKPVVTGELSFEDARRLRLQGLRFRGGLAFTPAASHVQLVGNDLTGPGGIFFFGDSDSGGRIESILIRGNHIHRIDYTGPQDTYRGYGIKSIGRQNEFTVRENTIKSVGADYIQTDEADHWTVEDNRFLGPSLARSHPQEHQDLWQVYAGGHDIVFTGNIARNTGTDQSLLFQMTYPNDGFSNVSVTDNLFVHDSRGYSCQIYQSAGLLFRDNTLVGSRWGCLFRDEPGFPAGSGYRVTHNIFAETREGADLSTEGPASKWGVYDYNVSSDGSASGHHSIRKWTPSWVNRVNYRPRGLPFRAGYRPGAG